MRHSFISEEQFKVIENRVRTGGPLQGKSKRMAPRGTLAASSPANPYNPFPLTIALTGQLPSGKNQVQLLFRNGKVQKYPNKTFTNWRSLAYVSVLEQVPKPERLNRQVKLTVDYWPSDARTRDVSGQLDALFHLLVYSKVLKDDGLIYDVVWRRHDMNKKFPKVVMELSGYV